MSAIRAKLTYANLVATLALFLALGGGAVYAAGKIHGNQIAKGAIKNRQLGKKVIKANNIRKNAVTETKIKARSVSDAKLGKGSLIVADASGGPLGGVNVDSFVDLPLSGQTSFTPVAGESYTLLAQARGSLPTGIGSCLLTVAPALNGQPVRFNPVGAILAGPGASPALPDGAISTGFSAAVGLLNPGVTQNITAVVLGNSTCPAATSVDAVRIVVLRAR